MAQFRLVITLPGPDIRAGDFNADDLDKAVGIVDQAISSQFITLQDKVSPVVTKIRTSGIVTYTVEASNGTGAFKLVL